EILPGHQREMARWPMTYVLEMAKLGKVLFCHATPRNENENFTKLTPEENLLPVFGKLDADLVVCGHTHMQFDRKIGNVRVVNAGSVGMPFGRPGAYWLLLGPEVGLRHTYYDMEKAAERIKGTAYPHAHQFAEGHVKNPPTEEAMLKILGGS
ncbi:MAG TPA: metallophosphoesterase family protein, partial [Cyclobacteriaceae bacterium]|nr:metallophosphoesterase family protein [Cyclobacteriaceae bacterium]